MFTDPRPAGQRQKGYYFFMWTPTDEGARNPDAVRDALVRASAIVRQLEGRCRLYVTTGGPCELLGIATDMDDAKAAQLVRAVNALGPLKTTFFKATDYNLSEYDALTREVKRLLQVKP